MSLNHLDSMQNYLNVHFYAEHNIILLLVEEDRSEKKYQETKFSRYVASLLNRYYSITLRQEHETKYVISLRKRILFPCYNSLTVS